MAVQVAPSPTPTWLVYHLEHIDQPLVGLTNQISPAFTFVAETELSNGTPSVSKFMIDTGSIDVIGDQGAAVFHTQFGYDEKRNSLDTGRSTLDFAEQQMDDIVDRVAVTAGDENFLAEDQVVAFIGGFGGSRQIRQ